MIRTRTLCLAAGLLMAAVPLAQAAETAPRTMELQILSDGRVVLNGELMIGPDALDAKLRLLRERGEPLEWRLHLDKDATLGAIAGAWTILKTFGLSLGLSPRTAEPDARPRAPDDSSI
jgi:hypothetical protein